MGGEGLDLHPDDVVTEKKRKKEKRKKGKEGKDRRKEGSKWSSTYVGGDLDVS